jgi:hypothetical protein
MPPFPDIAFYKLKRGRNATTYVHLHPILGAPRDWWNHLNAVKCMRARTNTLMPIPWQPPS